MNICYAANEKNNPLQNREYLFVSYFYFVEKGESMDS